MTFERMDIRGEKLDHLVSLVEPLIQDLDLDFPIRIDESLLVDEERNIFYLSFFGGGGGASLEKKLFLKKKALIILMAMKTILSPIIIGQLWKPLSLLNILFI